MSFNFRQPAFRRRPWVLATVLEGVGTPSVFQRTEKATRMRKFRLFAPLKPWYNRVTYVSRGNH
jgi:hypothetical protein